LAINERLRLLHDVSDIVERKPKQPAVSQRRNKLSVAVEQPLRVYRRDVRDVAIGIEAHGVPFRSFLRRRRLVVGGYGLFGPEVPADKLNGITCRIPEVQLVGFGIGLGFLDSDPEPEQLSSPCSEIRVTNPESHVPGTVAPVRRRWPV
jgi:hypothetical protein